MRKLAILALQCIIIISANAQATQEWVQSYTGAGDGRDIGSEIETDASGNVYVAGTTNQGISDADIVIMKYNSSGSRQWLVTINGSGMGEDDVRDMVVDANGNVYVTAASWGATVKFDFLTVKYNSSGVRQWAARFNGYNYDDEPGGLAVDASGNVFVAGFTDKGNDQKDFCLVKYNSAGTRVWSRTLNGSGNGEDIASDIRLDASGNVYVTGSSVGSGKDYLTAKYNSLGILQWSARYTGTGNLEDDVVDMELDSQGNVYVTGESFELETAGDYATVKYNSSGVQQWVRRYDNNITHSLRDIPRELAIDHNDNIIITGTSGWHPDYDMFTIKYSPDGTVVWTSKIDGGYEHLDGGKDIAIDKSGNIYVGGYAVVENTPSTSKDYATFKYSSSGTILWKKYFNTTGGNSVNAITLYTTSPLLGSKVYVYVTGDEYRSTGDLITTVKYSQASMVASPSVVEEISTVQSFQASIFPNPATNRIGVSYRIPATGKVRIQLSDVTGRIISISDKGTLSAGQYNMHINRNGLSKGVYHVSVVFDDNRSVNRITKTVLLE